MYKLYNKSIILVLLLSVIVFLIALYALLMQTFGIVGVDSSTIISGILSMVGGFGGALGAYFVATYQMNKQFEHEKEKDEKQTLEQIELSLIKLKKLNKDIIIFIEIFCKDFAGTYNENIVHKLKVREHDFLWIINKAESIDDEFLREELNIEYFDFSRGVQNLYTDFIGYRYLSEELQLIHLETLREAVNGKKEGFISFDKYLEEQIEKIKDQKNKI